jgi:hypothetical protein
MIAGMRLPFPLLAGSARLIYFPGLEVIENPGHHSGELLVPVNFSLGWLAPDISR